MKTLRWLTIFTALLAMASFTMAKKEKVIFFGDSITKAGVTPGGYIVKIGELATADKLGRRFDFVGAGVDANKVYDLYLRVDDDVLAKDPDVVVIYIGVNDVWHKGSWHTGTDADKFEKFYNALIGKLQAKGCKIVMCTPASVGERTDFSNQMDGELNYYCNIIRNIAKSHNLPLVDLRKQFLDYNLKNNPENKESGILTTDRVHLTEKGNQIVAEQMWKVIKSL